MFDTIWCCTTSLLSFIVLVSILAKLYRMYTRKPKKVFPLKTMTTIMVTGGVQGLGKLIVSKFCKDHTSRVNLIVVDIAEHLEEQMREEIKKNIGHRPGQVNTPSLEFFKCDLSDAVARQKLWDQIIDEYGYVHILINNAAICKGKKVTELSFKSVQQTMAVNFDSYVHFI